MNKKYLIAKWFDNGLTRERKYLTVFGDFKSYSKTDKWSKSVEFDIHQASAISNSSNGDLHYINLEDV